MGDGPGRRWFHTQRAADTTVRLFYTDALPLVRLDHDALERLKVGLFAEDMHPADRSVKDVVKKPPGC